VLAGSAVHLYCLGYVYNFDWERRFSVRPCGWLAWTIYLRRNDLLEHLNRNWITRSLALPAIVTLIPTASVSSKLFALFRLLNLVAYGALYCDNATIARTASDDLFAQDLASE